MTVLRLEIDSGPARQGAREFARSAEEIRRAAGVAEQSIRKVEGAFDRLRQSVRQSDRVASGFISSGGAMGALSVELPEIFQRGQFRPQDAGDRSPNTDPTAYDPAAYGRTGGGGAERRLEVEALRSGMDAATEATLRLDQSLGQALHGSHAFAEGARGAFADYADAATNTGAQIEQVVGRALGRLEDALVGFVQTGKLEWRSLIDAMIADLIRLFIRAQILGPLAEGLAGGLGGSGGLSGSYPGVTFTAQGAAFDGGRRVAFARGGVVGQPTLFPMARGIGLMGEAGPEAILPLKRLPGGDLGVRAAGGRAVFNQTIVNEAGVELQTEERENAAGGVDQLLVLVRRDAEQQMMGGQLGRLTAQRFGLSDRPFGR